VANNYVQRVKLRLQASAQLAGRVFGLFETIGPAERARGSFVAVAHDCYGNLRERFACNGHCPKVY